MNKNIGMAIAFVSGVAVGVVATYKIAETKYKNIADAEIESVVETFTNRQPRSATVVNNVTVEKKIDGSKSASRDDVMNFKSNIDRFGYDTVSTKTSKPGKEEVDEMAVSRIEEPRIFVISPDEYNTIDGFDTATFYYSSDNYLLNSDYEIVPDDEMKCLIGHDPYGHFGEYEDDSVYVRNLDLMRDYEILLSMKTCEEIMED